MDKQKKKRYEGLVNTALLQTLLSHNMQMIRQAFVFMGKKNRRTIVDQIVDYANMLDETIED